ncbi:S-layer homology domain-containing protein, partial [Klebsiella pneumoniae]|uniref:S-layer homology domain-containing protein n=1 Tax=Klebsiella pneumoniae TaxID=573 RepID=UPI003A8AB244
GTLEPNPMASFNDVPTQAWFSNYVLSAAKTGLIKGYPDGTFKPNNMISREEVLALVGRLVAAKGNYAGTVINNTVYNSTWGQTEINNAYSRINPAVLKGGM